MASHGPGKTAEKGSGLPEGPSNHQTSPPATLPTRLSMRNQSPAGIQLGLN